MSGTSGSQGSIWNNRGLLTGIETKTVMVLVTSRTTSGTDAFCGEASASVWSCVLPAFVIAFIPQRYLVKALSLEATKD